MQALISALIAGGKTRLDAAALDIAAIEFPSLLPAPYLQRLDEMGAELADETEGLSGPEFVSRTNVYLFHDLGFRGNQGNYYDPKNSCLNWVLDRRTGIPITLSVLYLEVARRAGRPVHGIGLPGHFVVQYDDGEYSSYIDTFNGGQLLSEDDCRELVKDLAGAKDAPDAKMMEPVGTRYILTRMLNNLRAAYFRREEFERAATVLDLLVQSAPATADYYKGRAIANVHNRKFRSASADFEQYLKLSPEAEDREDIVKQMAAIHRWLGALN
jgi:regulator of sirC expression with transglutaminase-like and TPR domain